MPSNSLRERLKNETRQIILDAFASCLAERDIDKVTYADVAARAGVGERTVYRHFPTRDELLRALYRWLSRQNGVAPILPERPEDLTRFLRGHFVGFDKVAPVMKAAVITPQGYELRQAFNDERCAAFLKALGPATAGLSEDDRRLVAAAVQHMHSASAWLAMRDNWGLDGEQAAKACVWAIRAMLDDLARRDGRALEDAPDADD